MKKRGLVLVSGGIDSSTLLAYILNEGYEVDVLSFRYGQRNSIELQKVKNLLQNYKINSHQIIDINLQQIGGSSLTDNIEVPKNSYNPDSPPDEIPATYVPARNTIFLSYALAVAEVKKINNIFFGAHIVDYSNYPDCRPEYIKAFELMANLGTEMGSKGEKITINAPFVMKSKTEIVKIGTELNVDFFNTISCYDPSAEGKSCGKCDACIIRLKAFAENNLIDPIEYA